MAGYSVKSLESLGLLGKESGETKVHTYCQETFGIPYQRLLDWENERRSSAFGHNIASQMWAINGYLFLATATAQVDLDSVVMPLTTPPIFARTTAEGVVLGFFTLLKDPVEINGWQQIDSIGSLDNNGCNVTIGSHNIYLPADTSYQEVCHLLSQEGL